MIAAVIAPGALAARIAHYHHHAMAQHVVATEATVTWLESVCACVQVLTVGWIARFHQVVVVRAATATEP
jgi:hypothetical protein